MILLEIHEGLVNTYKIKFSFLISSWFQLFNFQFNYKIVLGILPVPCPLPAQHSIIKVSFCRKMEAYYVKSKHD